MLHWLWKVDTPRGNRIKLWFHLSTGKTIHNYLLGRVELLLQFWQAWLIAYFGRQRGRMFASDCCVLYSRDWQEDLMELQQNFYRNNFWPAAAAAGAAAWRIDTYLAQRCRPTKVLTSGADGLEAHAIGITTHMQPPRSPASPKLQKNGFLPELFQIWLPHICNHLVWLCLQKKLPYQFNWTDVAFQLKQFRM